jgi:hypothetical protein
MEYKSVSLQLMVHGSRLFAPPYIGANLRVMADFVGVTLRKSLEEKEIKISFLVCKPLREMTSSWSFER